MKKPQPLVEPGVISREFDVRQSAALCEGWLDAFGRDRQGVNAKAYLWHIFSANRYPSVSGEDAWAQYREAAAPGYIVLSNRRDFSFVTDQRPERCYLGDYCVFPENFAWTMAFTHEDGWGGPYFARHQGFARLNEANLSKLEKLRQIEIARVRGWK